MSGSLRRGFPYHLAGAFLLLTATLAGSWLTTYRKSQPLFKPLDTIARRIQNFDGTDKPPLDETVLKELKPTSYLLRTYRKPGAAIDLFIAFYAQQRAGQSMHSPKHCLPGSGWEIWDYSTIELSVANRRVAINKYSISHETERRLVLYWYQSEHRIFASEYLGKLLLARDAFLQDSTAASIVRIVVPDEPRALNDARAFASALIPQVEQCFGSPMKSSYSD